MNRTLFSLALLGCLLATASAQTTSFTYQGRLADSGTPVNGNYDLQFALWNSLSGGSQVGSNQTLNAVAVNSGVFTVNLDFGVNAFPGVSRFLEIAVRPAGVGSFTTLTPRQPITSTPYAVRSLNAATADSVPASGVPSGSGNYIQNSTTPQSSSNFNISGSGTVAGSLSGNVVNATTQYNLNGQRILAIPGGILSGNFFAGVSANSVIGTNNTSLGFVAGGSIDTGNRNSLFGSEAGERITTGSDNTTFGYSAGQSLITTNFNTFFGATAGQFATGNLNTFVGASADFFSLAQSGSNGNRNTLLGANATIRAPLTSIDNATAIGANSQVDANNALVLGSINGTNGATADTNVGIGTTAPATRLHVVGNTGIIGNLGIGTTSPSAKLSVIAIGDGARLLHFGTERAWVFKQFGTGAETALELTLDSPTNNNKNFLITTTGFVGIGTNAPNATLTVNGSATKPGGGSWGTFSDERLKNIRGRFTPGLNALMRLQPLRYEYKPDNALKLKSEGEHIGFSAQAVQRIIPEAVTQTANGYLVVNNDPILWTMLNAIKEQQVQIQKQSELIEAQRLFAQRQQQEIAALKRAVSRRQSHRH